MRIGLLGYFSAASAPQAGADKIKTNPSIFN
jgi:hypothetical protein